MNRFSSLMTVAAFAASTIAAVPALAQEQHDRRTAPRARTEGQRADSNRAQPRADNERAQPRSGARTVERPSAAAPRSGATAVPRAQGNRQSNEQPNYNRPNYNRPNDGRSSYGRPNYARPHYDRPYYSRPGSVRPYYSRPYVFRPRLRIGFGVILGYPVPYDYAYPYPVPVYGYSAPPAPVIVGPNSMQYGGVSLEISPSNATVYVDGGYAGIVEDFDGTEQTLTLSNGRHRVDISAPGYEPMSIDVDVMPGQIVPYQGSLQPVRY